MSLSPTYIISSLWILLTLSQVLGSSSSSSFVFDGQTEGVGRDDRAVPVPRSDLFQLLASVPVDEFVLIAVMAKGKEKEAVSFSDNHSKGHHGDLNGFPITITRHNKIMQIFTTQTSEWHNPQEIVVASSNPRPDDDDYAETRIRYRRRDEGIRPETMKNESVAAAVADRLSDLMGQFRDVVGPFTEPNNNNNSTLNRNDSVNIERLRQANDDDVPLLLLNKLLSTVRPGTGVILVIENIQQLAELHEILRRDMSAIKLVLFRVVQDYDNMELVERTIEKFMQQLWRLHSVYYVFFVGFFGNDPQQKHLLHSPSTTTTFSIASEALFYNPFIRNSGGESAFSFSQQQQDEQLQQWGQLDKIPINCGLSKSLISNNNGEQSSAVKLSLTSCRLVGERGGAGRENRNEDVDVVRGGCGRRWWSRESVGRINYYRDLVEYIDLIKSVGVGMNYNGYPLRAIMFVATMTFLKSESAILNKTLDRNEEQQPLESAFFGIDVEVAVELSRRLNFTLLAREPSDDMDYGFQVGWTAVLLFLWPPLTVCL